MALLSVKPGNRLKRMALNLKSLLIFVLFCPFLVRADDHVLNLSKKDQQLHFGASFGIALTSTLILENYQVPRGQAILYGSLISLAVGAAKEYAYDKKASQGDMAANVAGIASSALLVWTFDF